MEIIYGKNPVLEALRAGRAKKVILTGGLTDLEFFQEVKELATKTGIPVALATKDDLHQLTSKALHQGVAAYVRPLPVVSLDGLLASIRDKTGAMLVLLDGVVDPQNLGSIIRTASAAGADGVIVRAKRSVNLTPAAVKASAGAAEHLPVLSVINLSSAIDRLKKSDFWIIGASEKATQSCFEVDLRGRIVLVLGAEGRGISRLVSERCDWLARIPLKGAISSLNVAVAGAVFLFEAVRQRQPGQ